MHYTYQALFSEGFIPYFKVVKVGLVDVFGPCASYSDYSF